MTADKAKPAQRETRPSAALPAQPRQAGNAAPRSKTKVAITQEDLANMRMFKLDPNDPKVVEQYARNKMDQGD